MKALTNWRYWVIAIMALVSVITILSEPAQESAWLTVFVVSKLLGLTLGLLLVCLIRRWSNAGALPELTDMINNVE